MGYRVHPVDGEAQHFHHSMQKHRMLRNASTRCSHYTCCNHPKLPQGTLLESQGDANADSPFIPSLRCVLGSATSC